MAVPQITIPKVSMPKTASVAASNQPGNKIAAINKSMSAVSAKVSTQNAKQFGLNKTPKAPKGMPGHVAVEHGYAPPKPSNSSVQGQGSNYFTKPN